MRALIKHVEVGEDGVRVVYKVQPCPFESGPQGGRSQHCWDGTRWHTGGRAWRTGRGRLAHWGGSVGPQGLHFVNPDGNEVI
jgi:hypothetical protein